MLMIEGPAARHPPPRTTRQRRRPAHWPHGSASRRQSLLPDALADVIQLPPGSHPQAVRGYLERATRTRGPVSDLHHRPPRPRQTHRRPPPRPQRAEPAAVRYDGLPWAWLADNLRPRKDRQTLVIADLTTDPDTGRTLVEDPARGRPPACALGRPSPRRRPARRHPARSVDPHPLSSRSAAAEPGGPPRRTRPGPPRHHQPRLAAWSPPAGPGARPPPSRALNGMAAVQPSPDLPRPPPPSHSASTAPPRCRSSQTTSRHRRPHPRTPPGDPVRRATRTTAAGPRSRRPSAARQPEQAIPIASGMSAALDRDRAALGPRPSKPSAPRLAHPRRAQAAKPPRSPLHQTRPAATTKPGARPDRKEHPPPRKPAYTLWHSLDDTAARRLAPDIAALLEQLPGTGPCAAHAAARLTTP
ncbi:hypothetical protein ACU686_26105 [Yinghuangia aomiensis]